jgi:hypothetical protein
LLPPVAAYDKLVVTFINGYHNGKFKGSPAEVAALVENAFAVSGFTPSPTVVVDAMKTIRNMVRQLYERVVEKEERIVNMQRKHARVSAAGFGSDGCSDTDNDGSRCSSGSGGGDGDGGDGDEGEEGEAKDASRNGLVPILPAGGGTCVKLSADAKWHLLIIEQMLEVTIHSSEKVIGGCYTP